MEIILKNGSKTFGTLVFIFFALIGIGVLTVKDAFGEILYNGPLLISIFLIHSIYEDEHKIPLERNIKTLSLKLFTFGLLLFVSFYNYSINFFMLAATFMITLYWLGRRFEIIKHQKYDEDWNEIIY